LGALTDVVNATFDDIYPEMKLQTDPRRRRRDAVDLGNRNQHVFAHDVIKEGCRKSALRNIVNRMPVNLRDDGLLTELFLFDQSL
jgi:hypothetical protein